MTDLTLSQFSSLSKQELDRLLKRGLSKQQAQERIAAQMSGDEKRRQADHVIDCSVSLEETERQVVATLAALRQEARALSSIS